MGASVNTAARSAGQQAFASLKNLKIGVKIAAGFAGVLAILVIVATISVVSLSQIDEKFKASSDTSDFTTVLRNIDHDFLSMRRLMREFTLTGKKQALDEANKLQRDLKAAVARALEEIKTPAIQPKLQSVAASLAAYEAIGVKFAVVRQRMDDTVVNVFDPLGRRLREQTEDILDIVGNSASISAVNMAHAIEINLLQSRLNGYRMLVKHDQASADYAQKYIDNLKASVGAFATITTNDVLRSRLQSLNADAKKFEATFQSIARDLMEIEGPLMKAATETGAAITAQIDAIVSAMTADEKRLDDLTHAQITASERMAILLTIVSLLAGGGLAWFIGAAISTPVRQMTKSMESLAAGDLDIDVTRQHRKDEIGAMARALAVFRDAAVARIRREEEVEEERRRNQEERSRAAEEAIHREREIVTASIGAGLARLSEKDLTYRMTSDVPEAYRQLQSDFNTAMAQLEEALSSVSATSYGVYTGTKEIAAAAGDLSRRTEQQAASLEETAAALDEITASIKQSADGAKQAREAVATARADAEKSGDVVRRAVEAMGGIDASSKQISQIIGVIDEIAFQTNLLALNAGVEAARAGDAGRGFAVVASEVRALAQRSAEAAKEIEGLIMNSTTQVRDGVVLVGETGKALERIVLQVAEINTLVEGIAASAQEQAGSLQQINSAANQMDQSTQQNAAMAEEATAASLTLSRRSEELTALIGRFSLGDGQNLRAELMQTAPHAFKHRAALANPGAERQAPGERAAGGRRAAGGQWSEF